MTWTETECDRLFSLVVRAKARNTCARCGDAWKPKDCAHIFGRAKRATRWDEANAVCLDRDCHRYLDQHPAHKEAWARDRMGDDRYEALWRLSNQVNVGLELDAELARLQRRARDLEVGVRA